MRKHNNRSFIPSLQSILIHIHDNGLNKIQVHTSMEQKDRKKHYCILRSIVQMLYLSLV